MSRTNRYLSGVGIGYLQTLLVAVCGLWLTRFLLDRVGPEGLGTWLVLLPLLGYLELIDLGVVAVLPREVALASGRVDGRDEAVAAVLGQARRLVWRQLPLAVLAATLFAGLSWVAGGGDGARAAAALGAVYVLLFPSRIYPAALQGLQDLAALGWINLASWLTHFLITVGLVLAGLGVWALVAGFAAQRTAAAALAWWRLRARFPAALPGQNGPPAEAGTMLRQGLWVSLGRVAQVMLNGTEVVILGRLVGPAGVVIYACTGKLSGLFSNHVYTLATSAEAGLSELRTGGTPDRLAQAAGALRQGMLFVSGLIGCVALATNEGFVVWWVGAERYGGTAMTLAIVLAMMVRHLTFTLGHLLYCLGHEKFLAVVGLADGAVMAAAAYFLIGLWGPLGAPLGSLAGVLAVSLPACVGLLTRESALSPASLLREQFPWLWRCAALLAAAAAVATAWQPRGVIEVAAAGVAAGTAYALVMCPVVVRSSVWVFLKPKADGLFPRLWSKPRVEGTGTRTPV